MFEVLGRRVVRHRRSVLGVAALIAVIGVVFGGPAFGKLKSGGFDDPHSQSVTAAHRIVSELGQQAPDVLVLYSSTSTSVTDARFRAGVEGVERHLRSDPDVLAVAGFYDHGDRRFVAQDGRATYLAIQLRASDDTERRAAYDSIKDHLAVPGLASEVGGDVAVQDAGDVQTSRDVARGEMIAMPIVLLLLVLIFRGVVAALMPLTLGVFAILGALIATRVLESTTTVSTFAINSITLLGLGMGVDYALIMVSRFRDELAAGAASHDAVVRTVGTAGRTIVVSGLTVTLSLASMLVFPEVFLKSMAYGGMAAVGIAMAAAMTILPALLATLGTRVNALGWRRRATAPTADVTASGWGRLAAAVMRRPVLGVVSVVAVLGLLALPLTHLSFGGFDQRVLPASSSVRIAEDHLAADFPSLAGAPLEVLAEGTTPQQAVGLSTSIAALPGATSAQVAASAGGRSLIVVGYRGATAGTEAQNLLEAIRALKTAEGHPLLVTGPPAEDHDLLSSLGARLPWMLAVMALVTLILLFLAFGSIVLPIKAVVVNILSVGAAFGVLVWGFQDGHLSGIFPFTTTGYLEPTTLIVVLALLFGLATDYEVFLLSRIREEWDRSHDADQAVVRGLARTGGLITAAALLLGVVTIGFATGQLVIAQLIGVGMVVGLALDALLVRIVLVPATMRLFGRASWWLPAPLARIYRRFGIRESMPAAVPAPV